MDARFAKFAIGQLVRHRIFPFRGVVFDVDPQFANTEEWWASIPEDVRPDKDQPFYHLLGRERAERLCGLCLRTEPAARRLRPAGGPSPHHLAVRQLQRRPLRPEAARRPLRAAWPNPCGSGGLQQRDAPALVCRPQIGRSRAMNPHQAPCGGGHRCRRGPDRRLRQIRRGTPRSSAQVRRGRGRPARALTTPRTWRTARPCSPNAGPAIR